MRLGLIFNNSFTNKTKKLVLFVLLIIGCATKPVSSSKPTVYSMDMSENEFKAKNDELEIIEQNKDGIVYKRKDCSECNSQYYTFIYGKLEAVTSFPISPNPMNFGFLPSTEDTQKDSSQILTNPYLPFQWGVELCLAVRLTVTHKIGQMKKQAGGRYVYTC